jgi:putative DNA primase/helicase
MTDLKAAAQAYHEQGIPVIPFQITKKDNGEWDKRPKVSTWQKWETEPQTEEDFQGLKWDGANGFGVILGGQAKNGLYLAVVDYDTKGATVSEEAKAKGKEILKELPVTQTQQTVNNGMHLIYYSRAKPHTEGTFHDSTGLELLGDKKICIMAPSFGYKNLNDNSPTEVQDLETVFYAVLAKHGFQLTEETEIQNQQDSYSFNITKLVDITKLVKIGPDEYQGSHPTHDSTTEKNFHINTRANTWFCFRHNSGGGALLYFAVKNGLIKCEQAKKGALRGKKFMEVMNLAVSQGLVDGKLLSQSEINPIILAKDIMEKYIFIVEDTSDTLYYFDSKQGVYSNKTERLIKREIARALDENTRARYYAEIENFIKHTADIRTIDENPELLVVGDGNILNVLTRELRDADPSLFLTRKIPHKYDENAKIPKILKFLEETLGPRERIVAQEYIGYCLYGDMIFKKAYIANGPTNTGKTVHQNVNTALLGEDNITNQTVQAINHNRFAPAELFGKMGNFCDDMPNSLIKTTGNFKMALGHGKISAEKKGKNPFNFRNKAKFWLNCNKMAPVAKSEDLDAYFDRLLIVDYINQIPDEKQNKNLIYELTTPEELSGYLNYALDGLKRLMENKRFSEYMTQDDVRTTYIKRTDSAKYFVEKFVTVTDNYDDYVWHDDLFHAAIKICHQEGLIPFNPGELTRSMQENCNGAHYTKIRPAPKTPLQPAWRYIKIKIMKDLTMCDFVPTFPNVQPPSTSLGGLKNKNKIVGGVVESRDSRTNGTNGTKTLRERLEQIKTWLCENKDGESLVDSQALAEKCQQLGVDVQKIVNILRDEYWLFEVPTIGKWGVK